MPSRNNCTKTACWCEILARHGEQTQLEQLKQREATGYKRYKLTPRTGHREKWPAYEAAVWDMVEHTSTAYAPWSLVEADKVCPHQGPEDHLDDWKPCSNTTRHPREESQAEVERLPGNLIRRPDKRHHARVARGAWLAFACGVVARRLLRFLGRHRILGIRDGQRGLVSIGLLGLLQ